MLFFFIGWPLSLLYVMFFLITCFYSYSDSSFFFVGCNIKENHEIEMNSERQEAEISFLSFSWLTNTNAECVKTERNKSP